MRCKRRTSKYYIHKEIQLLLEKLIHIKNLYYIYKKVYFNDGYGNILKKLPRVSSLVLQTIIDTILLELACLVVDKDDEDLSINSFIIKFHKYEKDYKEKRYVYITDVDSGKKHRLYIDTNSIKDDIAQLEEYLNKNKHIVNYIKKIRHKRIAHNNKKLNFQPKYKYKEMDVFISNDEIEKFIESLFNYMNSIYSTLCKIQFCYINEIDGELVYLNKLLEIANKCNEFI